MTTTAKKITGKHFAPGADKKSPLSAAFDTIDRSVLLKRRSCSFGVAGNVLSWIQSYLTGRTQSVRIGSHSSPPNPCSVSVPQGSVLRPLIFSIYTSPISTIANSHQVSQQQYADDTQLYVALLPANYSQDISALESCLNSLRIWFYENGMALNPTKSVAILFGTPKRLKTFSGLKSCNVAGIQTSNSLIKLRSWGPR